MPVALAEKSCTPCRGGIPPLTESEAAAYHAQAPDWAEAEGHHPDIGFGWGYARVSLHTKKIKGLHENDFIMAAKLDRIAAESAS